jgi:hypothetical protein
MALFRAIVEGHWEMKIPADDRTGIVVNCKHEEITSRCNLGNAC